MAGLALPGENQSLERHPNAGDPALRSKRDLIREHAAKLYGQGFPRAKVARLMIDHLQPHGPEKPLEQRMATARAKLRRWEASQEFRDMIYQRAVVDLDMATPGIMRGVAKKAARGRVDAARLVLELTGRHNPKGDAAPAQVVVAINGVPRPARHSEVGPLEVEGEVVAEDED